MKLVRYGITRDVFVFRSFVVKVPKLTRWKHFLQGLVANMEERTAWDASLASLRVTELENPLCPIIWSSWGGWILVMRRADPYPCHEVHPDHQAGTTDTHSLNYGMLKGRPVCIDYA